MAIEANDAALRQLHGLFAGGTATGLADSQLLDRFLGDRDPLAFEALLVRHGAMVMSVCRGILRPQRCRGRLPGHVLAAGEEGGHDSESQRSG